MIKNEKIYQYIQLISLLLLPWGLFFFEAIPSILVITFSIPLILYGRIPDRRRMIRNSWPFFVIYGILLVSGFWSGDTGQWLNLLRVNLPFVVMPLAFYLWPDFLLSQREQIQRQFVWAGGVLSLYLVWYLFFHQDEVLRLIQQGGSFPVPVHHVRSSLFLAVAGIVAWDEVAKRRWMTNGYVVYSCALVFLIIGIHLLAVRTGLILFYAGTFLMLLLNNNFHGKKGVSWIVSIGLLMILVIVFIPTLQEKWNYFQEDIRNYHSNSWWFYSDALRWQTNEVGLEIAKSAPLWGIGMGDVLGEMHMRFYVQDTIRVWEYPHNLWITILAGSGVVGFVSLTIALGSHFIQLLRRASLVFSILFILYMGSCLVENTILTSLGSISFILIMLISNGSAASKDGVAPPEQN